MQEYCVEVLEAVEGDHWPLWALDRFRPRLQDPRHHIHGVRVVGVQVVVGEGYGVQGLQGHALQ